MLGGSVKAVFEVGVPDKRNGLYADSRGKSCSTETATPVLAENRQLLALSTVRTTVRVELTPRICVEPLFDSQSLGFVKE